MTARRLLVCLVIAAASSPVAAADPSPAIGRLFFTPGQRASLDVARSQRTRATVATERTEQLVVEQPVPQTITYGGMVRRSDGRTTVWINDRAVEGGEKAGGATIVRRVGPDGAVTLEVPQSNRRVDLKVGQSVEVLSGSVGDGYRGPPPTADKPKEKPATDGGAANRESGKSPSRNPGNERGSSADEPAAPQESGAATAGAR